MSSNFEAYFLKARVIFLTFFTFLSFKGLSCIVLYPKKGVCADPVDEGAILGKGGANPHSSDKEHQLAPDTGRGKT